MKNLKKGILAIGMLAMFTTGLATTTAYANNNNSKMLTTINQSQEISKMVVKGNVEVFITQGKVNSVKVFDNYYSENAYIQNDGSVLRITSYGDRTLSVWVTVSELSEIEASDYAQVYTINTINALDMKVTLNNHAKAKIDIISYKLTTKIAGDANLELVGKTELQQTNVLNNANVDLRKFVAIRQDLIISDNGGITIGSAYNNQDAEIVF
jgi:hypothetical protein